jgi:ATP-dependent DNA ligase
MAARIDHGRAQLLTRTGLDWTEKYPSAIAALANLNVKNAYIDGELCGVYGAASPHHVASERPAAAQHTVRLPLVLSRVHWVEPKLVAEITYLTADGLLRHTVYVGLREDKPAEEVRRSAH